MTIAQTIARLQEAASASKLGLDTVVVLCEPEQEYRELKQTILDADEDGALVLLKFEPLGSR